MSKWKAIDSAPMGVTVWAKVEGINATTGKSYEKCKVVLAEHPTKGVMVIADEYPKWQPIAGDLNGRDNWPLTHWKHLKQSKWIVKNPTKLKLREMSEEDAYEVFKAWRKDVGADEKALYVYDWDGYWVECCDDLLCPYSIYRVKRQDAPESVVEDACIQRVDIVQENAPLWEVDWNKVDKRCGWVAVDNEGGVWGYINEPTCEGRIATWEFRDSGYPSRVAEEFVIKPLENPKENWKKSLIKRPEGV